jgi:ABC-type multidrug transport system fused ATPase/permease subunit
MRATRKVAIFLKPYWRWAILAPLCMVLEAAMDLMQPRLIQRIVDQGIARSDMAVVVSTAAWMFGLALIGMAGGLECAVFAILAGTRQFGRPLSDIANLYNTIQAAVAGAERVFEIIDEPDETDAPEAQPIPRIRGEVVFDDVSFAY